MPIEQIANAATSLGDQVEVADADAPIKEGWEKGGTLIRQGEGRILVRKTGDTITIAPLTSSQTPDIPSYKQPLNNIEGIGVYPSTQNPGANSFIHTLSDQELKEAA